MKKGCELCDRSAAMYCESDQASLCWDCDARVHGANFLVARHSRRLLCRRCRSPTPWTAEGPRLSPTAAVCERCLINRLEDEDERETDEENEDERETDVDVDVDDDDDDDEEEEEEEDGEYQVVPWAMTPPPPVASSSSSEESSFRMSTGFLKGMQENSELASQDNGASSSFQQRSHLVLPPHESMILARTVTEDEVSSFSTNLHYFMERKSGFPVQTPIDALNISNSRNHQKFDLVSSSSHNPPI